MNYRNFQKLYWLTKMSVATSPELDKQQKAHTEQNQFSSSNPNFKPNAVEKSPNHNNGMMSPMSQQASIHS